MIHLIAMLMILAVFSIFFGFITKDMFIGLGSGFFSDNALFIHPSHEIMLDTEFAVPTLFKLLPLVFTISLSVISIVLSEYLSTILMYFKLSRVGYNIFSFFNQRFLIEAFYNRYITGIVLKLGGQTTKVLDKGSVEYIGPYGLEKGLLNISNNIAKLSTGVITTYALYILIGLIFYLLSYSYVSNSIVILALCLSLSLVLFKSSTLFTTVTFESSFYPTILRSSPELTALVAILCDVVDSVPGSSQLLESAKEVAETAQQVTEQIVSQANQVQDRLTDAYDAINAKVAAEGVGASPEVQNDLSDVVNQAKDIYGQGVSEISEAADGAKELYEDESSSESESNK
ncbi:MAG: hypothetical protein EOP34_08105 [Rickettsiales bacterium]|nr:MAG: hypothetical protein EOP34_08105 [Rickettsiales bacterium]